MMRHSLLPVLLALLLAGPIHDACAQSLTLERCITLARAAAPSLQAAESRLEAELRMIEAAAAARLPVLRLAGSLGWVSEVQRIVLPGGTVEFGDGSSVDFALEAALPLYSGGALRAAVAAAEAGGRAAMHRSAGDSLAIDLAVRRTYYGALGAEAVLRSVRTGEARLARHLEELRGAREAGLAGEEELLAVESRLQRARQDVCEAEGGLRRARLELGSLLGHPGEEAVPEGDLERSLLGAEEGVARWPGEHALEAGIRAAEELARQAEAARRPQLGVIAGWHMGRPGVDPVSNEWMSYGAAGLSLSWTLWNGRADRLRAQRARLEARSLEHDRDELRRRQDAALAQARGACDTARGAERAAARRVELERELLSRSEARLAAGAVDRAAHLDSLDDLALAELDRERSLAGLRMSESELLYALGGRYGE